MQQIRQDPQKLRDFCNQLNSHATYWQTSIGELQNFLSRLSNSWQDEQFEEFGKEVTQLKTSLDEFATVTRTTVLELQQDAERLEEYLRIQNEV